MIQFENGTYSQDAWNDVTAGVGGVNLMQDWSYGEAKARTAGWQVERGIFADGDRTVGAAQVLIKALPVVGGGLAWINRGPLVAAGADYYQSLQALRRHYVTERGFYLRVAPLLQQESLDEDALAGAGFRKTDAQGWSSAVLDLAPDIDALRAGLRANWRSHLNKAQRADLQVDTENSGAAFDGFLREYSDFLEERKIATTVTPDLLSALQQARSGETKMLCYRCGRDDDPLGSVLIARTGDTSEYLVGTLLGAGRKFGVGQLLVWRAICDMKDQGVRWFDVGGMDADNTPKGIFDFKAGIGGKPYRLAPEIEATKVSFRSTVIRWSIERRRRIGA